MGFAFATELGRRPAARAGTGGGAKSESCLEEKLRCIAQSNTGSSEESFWSFFIFVPVLMHLIHVQRAGIQDGKKRSQI